MRIGRDAPAAIEKITGKGPFRGTADDTVSCGRWDTRL